MKNIIFCVIGLIIFLNPKALTAQYSNCKFQGKVIDSLGVGIYDVSIIVFNPTGEGTSFTYTNKLGLFNLELPCDKKIDIQFEHLEYNSYVKPIFINQNKGEIEEFTLSNNKYKLDEVLIIAKTPIKVIGDTLEFDASSFKTGSEENLEDLLKNLPGVQVDNGKIYYEGKEIKNITVEGREIFGGNVRLLNKNLPSNSIDKIQLNKKFKKNPFANSIQQDDDFSLNIVLEGDKKSLIFGSATAGANFKEHSNLQAKTFYFTPKIDATLIADSNTFGKEVFTREDFIGFMGGLSNLRSEGGQYSLRSNIQPIASGLTKDASNTRADLGAIHFGYSPNEKLYTNGFVLYTEHSLEYKTVIDRVFNDITVRQTIKEGQELKSALAQARIDYFPSGNSEIKYKAVINDQESLVGQFIENSSTLGGVFNPLGNQSFDTDRTYLNFSHNFSYVTKVRENDNFGFYITHNYQKDKPNYFIESSDTIFSDVFDNQTEEDGVYNIEQDQRYNINTIQLYSVYNYLINNTINLKAKLGINSSHQKFNNSVFSQDVLLSEEQQLANAELSYEEYYGDINITKIFDKFKIDLGGSLNRFEDSNSVLNETDAKLSELAFLPHFTLKYEWNIAKSLSLDYKKAFSYPEAKALTGTYQIQDAYTLFLGNSGLNREVRHNLNINYKYSKFTSFINFYSEFAFNKIENSIQTSSFFNSETQLNSSINSDKDAYSYYLGFYIDKRINRYYTIKFQGNLSINDYYTQANSSNDPSIELDLVENNVFGQNYVWTNNFKIKKRIEFDLGLSYVNNKYKTDIESVSLNFENNFQTWRPFIDLSWMVNDKMLFRTKYSFEKQINNDKTLNEYNDLSFSLRYKLFKKTYISLIAGNLLDNQLVTNSFNSNYSQILRRERLGGYYLINLKYKF